MFLIPAPERDPIAQRQGVPPAGAPAAAPGAPPAPPPAQHRNERIATCQEIADGVATQMDGSTVDVAKSELEVRISPSDGSNPLLVAAIFILLLAAVGLTVMVWRSSRLNPELDLRDMGDFPNYDDDAFLRRN